MFAVLRDFFFPQRLQRISHIIRFFLCVTLFWWLAADVYMAPLNLLWMLVTLLYLIIFCIAPRARDSGLPVWSSWLFLIPAVNVILVYALFFSRTKRPELELGEA